MAVGVSWPVGTRWFRHAGGMPPISLAEPTGRYLTFEEREEISLLRAKGAGVRQIARALARDPGTISRELRRNAATRGGTREYRATVAQWKAQQAAKRPKVAKLVTDDRLREYVQQRLDGTVRRADGTVVAGPDVPGWKGRKMKPHRADRRWTTAWSPQQISHRLRIDFPEDESMRISHEAIYQALFIQGRGALKRELVACLRTGRALREPRARTRNKPQGHVTADVVLSQRPAEAADRAVPGHWEGDLIIGTGRSAIGTLVERSSRSTLLVHLPRLEGWGEKPVVKNGPSLGGYGAVAMNAALTASMTTLPEQLRKTLTWDRGKELSGHALFALATGTKVFFADPHSPWQRPTNENSSVGGALDGVGPFHLREQGQQDDRELSHRVAGVRGVDLDRVREVADPDAAVGEVVDQVEGVAHRAPQAVQGVHDDDVALTGVLQHRPEARPVGGRAGLLVQKDLVPCDAGRHERLDLPVKVLLRRRDACVAQLHRPNVPKVVSVRNQRDAISGPTSGTARQPCRLGSNKSWTARPTSKEVGQAQLCLTR